MSPIIPIKTLFRKALLAADPARALREQVPYIMSIYGERKCHNLQVLAFGKTACQMVKAIEDPLSAVLTKGIVITKYGHCKYQYPKKIAVFEAGHPLPDLNGMNATKKVMNMVKQGDEQTLIICLISGGGSALLVAPHEGISLQEKVNTTELLLKSGADIQELNTVRKHISGIKGGRLAELVYPTHILSFIVSDVIGDRLDVIASGPTAPDPSTYRKALSVLRKYSLVSKVPKSVLELIVRGTAGMIAETPKRGAHAFRNVSNKIIVSNKQALLAARDQAIQMGFQAELAPDPVIGEARVAGQKLAEEALRAWKLVRRGNRAQGKMCLISGGETTVTVKGDGSGGRNMELALSFAMAIEGVTGIMMLSAGTDGTDGPTDAAGAIIDGDTIKRAKAIGLNPNAYLQNNDSYNFFKKLDSLLITGPTGTNVMDIQIVVIE